MEAILKKIGLEMHSPCFIREKISPDIVCKLSAYELKCLGVANRSDMMKLRVESVPYGKYTEEPSVKKRQLFDIPKYTLESLLGTDFKISDISNMSSVSCSTVYRKMAQYNLSKRHFTDIDVQSLDLVVQELLDEFPRCGEKMLREILKQRNIKIPRSELRESLHRIDEIGIQKRSRTRLHRRIYEIPGPNHLWHVDTNHKLIRWHFVIVGGVDGFSRLVTFLKCTSDNKADTVLSCFKSGVEEFGLPLRVRSDKGMENSRIADYMISLRGQNRGSMITGKSTHNQRIERLWRDVYDGVLSYYYELFHFMEDEGMLDIMNERHIIALHYVFIFKINEKLDIWRKAWATHRIRTVRSSPIRLFTAGMVNNPTESTDILDITNDDNQVATEIEDITSNQRPTFTMPQYQINDLCQNELDANCPKNWTSTNFGIDVFVKAVQILENQD